MEFEKMRDEMKSFFGAMGALGDLFQTNTDPDEIWEVYLNSFPEGTNPVFRERTEHDCSCCKAFIRQCGNIVVIGADYELISIWDFHSSIEKYNPVLKAMSAYVKSKPISGIFLSDQSSKGVLRN